MDKYQEIKEKFTKVKTLWSEVAYLGEIYSSFLRKHMLVMICEMKTVFIYQNLYEDFKKQLIDIIESGCESEIVSDKLYKTDIKLRQAQVTIVNYKQNGAGITLSDSDKVLEYQFVFSSLIYDKILKIKSKYFRLTAKNGNKFVFLKGESSYFWNLPDGYKGEDFIEIKEISDNIEGFHIYTPIKYYLIDIEFIKQPNGF